MTDQPNQVMEQSHGESVGGISLPHPTPEARRYVVKELARRAGVSRHEFATWNIDVRASETIISLGNGSLKTVRVQHQQGPFSTGGGTQPLHPSSLRDPTFSLEAYLVLPFLRGLPEGKQPLFDLSRDASIVCPFDILASFLFTLCRREEASSRAKDEHGRFPAAASLAVRQDYLERPILDEIGLQFEKALLWLLPGWKPAPRKLRVKLSHDIDSIGLPFRLTTAVGHSLKRRNPKATLHDVAARLDRGEPADLRLVRKLAAISKSRALKSAFYWKASMASLHDTGYDPCDPKVQAVIRHLHESGLEVGVHPGYYTFADRGELSAEVQRLKVALNVEAPGGRQHYLRWSPNSWLDWEACGLSYDSSVGYAERFGFRAGTSFPYRPWSIDQNRELDLLEIPLILMDCTPVKYMQLSREQGLARIRKLIQRTELVGGVFTLLWHNTPLSDPAYNGWYESILDMLVDAQQLELPPNPSFFW